MVRVPAPRVRVMALAVVEPPPVTMVTIPDAEVVLVAAVLTTATLPTVTELHAAVAHVIEEPVAAAAAVLVAK